MTAKAEELYERARALPPAVRVAFVEDACRGEPQLREELVSLLRRAEAAEQFFERLSGAVFSSAFPIGEAAEREDPNVGRTIAHYRIVSHIASGGMGTVYRAHDTRLNRDVALKFLPSHLSAQPDAEERLFVEARAAASLEHPNVCVVHEIGETEDGRPFIVMALCEGETLKERFLRGPLAVEEAVSIAGQIARGLAAAHAAGILHRDVKPGNIMLGPDGTVKLLDFGLAKVADATITRPGMTPGTMAYMSPEQARGDPVDQRTDLWSLGVVLYEMLTGVRPFRGGSDGVVLQAILHEDPEPVSRRRPEIPEPLARIVERLLRKDRGARFGSAAELLPDLELALSPGGGRSRPSRRRPALLIGTATAFLALAGAAFWLAGRGGNSAPALTSVGPAGPSIAVLPLTNLSADPADAVLADGMTEELIAMLARTGNLRVIARTSVYAFKDRPTDVRSIADSLGVSNILEGGLQKIGPRLRVQVRLVDARDGATRWSETYDREIQDVFLVQEQIAQSVARELGVRLTGGAAIQLRRSQTRHVAAYELYLRGSDPALMRSDNSVRQGVEYFRQAIAIDSAYAAAYAGLARLYVRLANADVPGRPIRELYALAEAAALQAVALDDSLGEAHAALGLSRMASAYDFTSAEREFKRAIELDPTQARIREWLGLLYLRTGRPAEALEEARRSLEIDPLSATAHAEVAHALLANGRHDEALAQLEHIASVRPPLLRTAVIAAQAYGKKGRWQEAVAALRPQAERGDSRALSLYGYLLASAGQRAEALRIHATLLDRWRRGESRAFEVAVGYAGLGDFAQAFAWLDKSLDDHSILTHTQFNVMEPIFEDLRSDPRFEPLKRRLGLQKR